jgi:hypothetical protein
MDRLTSNQLRLLVGSMIWLLYWVRSRRVRATFGAAALDKTVIAWPEGQDNATTAVDARAIVRNARWWGRMAVRTLGVLAAAVVVLLMIGLWVSHSSAYAAPNGDIRAAVTGRWTWAADTAGCRDAHVIAFPDSGKVMTIATRDMAGGVKLTTYDILLQTSSTIRGAIRGETRMTAAGKPVIWDLVLTGPDEYRWKRTDWTSTPWSYTGPIHRCPALTVSDSGAS